jgi:ethanolamine transporter EutH
VSNTISKEKRRKTTMGKFYGMIEAFIGVLIGIVLTPIVYTTANSANVSGTTLTILTLIPVIFAVSVLVLGVKSMLE